MNARLFFILLPIIFFQLAILSKGYSKSEEDTSLYVAVGSASITNIKAVSGDEATKKIFMRNDLERQGWWLAEHMKYEEALEKYQQALNPELLNEKSEGSTARGAIINIYKRMGNFEEALKKHLERKGPEDNSDWPGIDKELELEALIKARDSGSSKPVYDHIEYLKEKYKKYIPPPGDDSGYHGVPIETIIHLYDYLDDAQGGISFMNYVLSSKKISAPERHEYERVKAAFEEDKHTGRKGHLQKVIETSDYIGW